MSWRTISTLFADRRARFLKEKRLQEAYARVFTGDPSSEDQELVLADLAFYSGFAMVTPPDASPDFLRHTEGKRDLFARIRRHLNLSHSDVLALENAARQEAAILEYQAQAQ